MRLGLFVAAIVLGACTSAPASDVPGLQTAAATGQTDNIRAVVGASPTSGGTSAETAVLVKGSPEAKAAGLRCERSRPQLGSNKITEVCTTKAEREAAAKAGQGARDAMRDYRSGQNASGKTGSGQ